MGLGEVVDVMRRRRQMGEGGLLDHGWERDLELYSAPCRAAS